MLFVFVLTFLLLEWLLSENAVVGNLVGRFWSIPCQNSSLVPRSIIWMAIFGRYFLSVVKISTKYCLPTRQKITIGTHTFITILLCWPSHHHHYLALAKLPPPLPSWPPPPMPLSHQAAASGAKLATTIKAALSPSCCRHCQAGCRPCAVTALPPPPPFPPSFPFS